MVVHGIVDEDPKTTCSEQAVSYYADGYMSPFPRVESRRTVPIKKHK
jgi:hypothetical protein